MDVTVRLRWFAFCCLWFALAGAFSLASGDEKGESSQRWNPDSLLVSESLSKNGNMPIVSVQVAGKECRFLVDTSALDTKLDKSLCAGLKPFRLKDRELPVEPKDKLQPPEMKLGQLKLSWILWVDPFDSSYLSMQNGEKIHGILGMEVLKELVLQIDADHDMLQIAVPSVRDLPPGIHLPLEIDRDFVAKIACAVAPGKLVSFAIDTSCYDNGSVDQGCAQQILANGGRLIPERKATLTRRGEIKKLDTVNAPSVALSDVALRTLEFSVEDENRLGFDSLLRFRIAFDFKNRRVFFLPSKLIDCQDRHGGLGMLFDTEKPLLTVREIEKGLGSDAGVFAGDRLHTIGGFDVESQFSKAYRALYAPSRAATAIEVERNGGRLKKILASEQVVGPADGLRKKS